MKIIIVLLNVLTLITCACSQGNTQGVNKQNHMKKTNARKFIGIASMEEDGTIALKLFRTKFVGKDGKEYWTEGYFRYEPSHPKYQKILEHIGELKPGESKNVLPWPDKTENEQG